MFSSLSKNEKAFLVEAIKADCRADARSALETRLLRHAELKSRYAQEGLAEQIRFGSQNGQVLVKIGQTRVVT